ERTVPTEKQIASLKALINYLLATTAVTPNNIVSHQDMPGQATACPGKYLPVKDIVTYRFASAR
ncbi:MAG: N-acetylmuramoyl-L-alanine amidase, partial [Planctomycetes bacterium]|nr:N-acetylmuramoyl-L-alanine amidase [Planctomycetota bacterium]